MFFIAHVKHYCDYCNEKPEIIEEKSIIYADTYTEAMQKIENTYGSELESVEHLEAICNNPVLYINDEAEELIRANEYNTFF